MIFWQPLAVGVNQVIHQFPDLVEIQFGSGVRVEHGGVVNMIPLARHRRLDHHRLHVNIGLHQRGQVRRQRPDLNRLDAVFIDRAGYFNAAAGWQVID